MGLRLWGALLALSLAGCSVIVNSKLSGKDGETDGGMATDSGEDIDTGSVDPCNGADDGTSCGSGLLCVDNQCMVTVCGDGVHDPDNGELCDDGNDESFDGCEPGSCTFSCTEDEECRDENECNGFEVCGDEHFCDIDEVPDELSPCSLGAGMGIGECRNRRCVPMGCGNGVMEGDEECDDGDTEEGNGCDNDCTFSCNEDADCNDGDICNGEESCDVASHACVPGTDMVCEDDDACTANNCDPVMGCEFPLIDEDGDLHASSDLGECGDDCDDTDPTVYTGAEELCNDDKDNNCNGDTDEGMPMWYVDCDDDGFAENTNGAMAACNEPPPLGGGCNGWTNTRPTGNDNTDCHDGNANVYPGQQTYFETSYTPQEGGSSYDYDCDGTDRIQYGCLGLFIASCSGDAITRCSGSIGYANDGTFCTSGTFIRSPSPACGQTGQLSRCDSTRLLCDRVEASYRQRCR